MKFTDLLDEYLEASNELKNAKEAHQGYDFDYFHWRVIDREKRACIALNEAFEKLTEAQ